MILAHPEPGSFNHAIAEAAQEECIHLGHDVRYHDLYAEGLNPVLPGKETVREVELPPDIDGHCRELAEAEGIIIVHPNWWGQPPAILKGWIDRVIRPGVAYEFLEGDSGEGIPRGLLKVRAALIFNTSNTESNRERKVFGDPLDTLWKNCIFGLCGVPSVYRRMFNVIATSTPGQRAAWLGEVKNAVRGYYRRHGMQD